MTYQTGWADGPPVRPGYMVADYSAGVFAAMGTMMALRARDVNGGVGQDVDVALYEAIWKQSGTHASQFQMAGHNRERSGNYWPGVVPAEQWQTADGHHLIINATTQGTFERLVAAMDQPELLLDPRFEVHRERRQHYEAIHEIVGEWIASLTLEQAQHLLDKHGVPATKVYTNLRHHGRRTLRGPRPDCGCPIRSNTANSRNRASCRVCHGRREPSSIELQPSASTTAKSTAACSGSAMMYWNSCQRTE